MKSRARSSKPSTKAVTVEPDFVMLLADPEIRLLMRADNVDEAKLRTMLQDISVYIQNESRGRSGRTGGVRNPDTRKYRKGVGVMLFNSRGEVFIARRIDMADAWQMPQGGIDRGETPAQAAYRELKEEIGTNNAEIVAESPHWLYYAVPTEIAKASWGGRWKGQRQKWFAMRFKGDDGEINLATSHPEFDAWRWAPADDLEALAVSFKKSLYISLLREFAAVLHDRSMKRPSSLRAQASKKSRSTKARSR